VRPEGVTRLARRRTVVLAPLVGAVAPDSWRRSSFQRAQEPAVPTTTAPQPSRATAARGRLLVLVVPARQQVTVLVAGGVDRASAPQLREGLLGSLFYRPASVLVDAADLTACDASGLDALVDAVETVGRSGVDVTVEPSPELASLLTTVDQLP
jgi:anti-anti-sigma regulatory factor